MFSRPNMYFSLCSLVNSHHFALKKRSTNSFLRKDLFLLHETLSRQNLNLNIFCQKSQIIQLLNLLALILRSRSKSRVHLKIRKKESQKKCYRIFIKYDITILHFTFIFNSYLHLLHVFNFACFHVFLSNLSILLMYP